jgi:hypothetical protein
MIRPAFAAEAPATRRQPPRGRHTPHPATTPSATTSRTFSAKRAVKAARLMARNGRPVVPFAALGGRALTCGNVGGPP